MSDELATGQSTFDASPAYRPGLPDINGAGLRMRGSGAADPRRFPTANQLNGQGLVSLALAGILPAMRIVVTYVSGSPRVAVVYAGVKTVPNVSVARTGGGSPSGDVIVSWPTDVVPPPLCRPRATLLGSTPGLIVAESIGGFTDVEVITAPAGGDPADMPFELKVF